MMESRVYHDYVEVDKHASSLPDGKSDGEFIKKPDIALKLIDKCLGFGEKPGIVLVDAGYGNNSKFLKQLESKNLKYIAGLAKNRIICLSIRAGGSSKRY